MRHGIWMIGLAAVLAGCGDKSDSVSGEVTDGEGKTATYSVTKQGEGAVTTVRTADGSATIRTGDTASAMPAGLALYPGARLTSTMAIDSAKPGEDGAILSFESPDPAADILAFYKKAAEQSGYAIAGEMVTGDMAMITARKGESGFNLTVTRNGPTSHATLIAGKGGGAR